MNLDIFNIKAHLKKHRERKRAEQAQAAERQARIDLKRNNRLLRDAVDEGDIGEVKSLLAKGAFSEDHESVTNDYTETALQIAWDKGLRMRREPDYSTPDTQRYLVIAELLRKDADERDPARREKRLRNMLMDPQGLEKAIEASRISDVKYLLSQRTIPPSQGAKCLDECLVLHKREIAQMLIDSGIKPTRLSGGNSPLDRAATTLDYETVKLMLDNGADPQRKDPRNMTLLARAVKTNTVDPERFKKQYKIVNLLLDRGVDPDAKDDEGNSARTLAASNNPQMLAVIEQRCGKSPANDFSSVAGKQASPPAERKPKQTMARLVMKPGVG